MLYFARGHTGGVRRTLTPATQAEAKLQIHLAGQQRISLRAGSVIRTYEGGHTADTAKLWDAIGVEWRTVQGANRPGDARWNIWLANDGTVATYLTPFQETKAPLKEQYVRLNNLNGRHPMQLVLQTAERKELERAVFGDTWRVCPTVVEAVRKALADYSAVRAPLYPLSKIQRLGYLDDNDDVLCVQALGPFQAGQRYALSTKTIQVKRSGEKLNLTGEVDEVMWEGSELALFIKGSDDVEHLFMEERLRADNVRLSIQKEDENSPIEYSLQELADHFEIPEVSDVAAQNPEGYERLLAQLTLLENLIAA